MNPTVAIVAQGAMGSAVGQRLVERGIQVTTSLAGRSEASAQRAKKAGMVPVSDQETARADFFLSIVPPSDALSLAEKMAGLIGPTNHKPIYVDCNIGGPPKGDYTPALYAAGEDAVRFAPLGAFGLDVRVIEGQVGAAAALKMSYAGITKGFTALGSMMLLAATRNGVGERLRAELELSQPALLGFLTRSVPGMYSKAYRFVGEMEEIADFVGDDEAARKMYESFAQFYTRLAADFEGPQQETGALSTFLKKKD